MRWDRASVLLAAFGVAAVVDLGALALGSTPGHVVAKPLLMPLLAAYAYTRGGPRPLVAALLFGWGGDVLLLSDVEPAFLAGMGSFAVGHVCYLVLFGKVRRPEKGLHARVEPGAPSRTASRTPSPWSPPSRVCGPACRRNYGCPSRDTAPC